MREGRRHEEGNDGGVANESRESRGIYTPGFMDTRPAQTRVIELFLVFRVSRSGMGIYHLGA